jgi:DNA polymerase I-like protein with 3'-5' exonuclease and polymerase domains
MAIRKYDKLRGTFIESYILQSAVNGKVYGQFHPLRGDSNGTRSGRLASSTPNLQNLPSRDEELAPLVRGIFCPDPGHERWVKIDYSQIEYRFMIHYALGPGSEEARTHFNTHPDTDYHEMTLDLVAPAAGWDISTAALRKKHRKPIKNINFGLIYGMGVDKLSRSLGLTAKEGKDLFAAYHRGVPFAKPTMDYAMSEAAESGTVSTILGRKSRFNLWEPATWGSDTLALPYEEAILRYGNIRRAYTHKALNRRLQGSAADLMKMAMWKCWESGVFHATGVPRLTVHDELDFSDPGGRREAFREMKRILETAIPLKIPVRADADAGPDWGNVTECKEF